MTTPHILSPRCWLLCLGVVVDLGREAKVSVLRWLLQDATSACRWEESGAADWSLTVAIACLLGMVLVLAWGWWAA